MLPEDISDPDQVEETIQMLMDIGIEATSDSAIYFLGGIYLEDNLGKLFIGKEDKWNFTPSFGLGYYDDGNGKKLGNKLEFRTTLELSYRLNSKL